MAIGNIRKNNRNFARPAAPTITSVTTSAATTDTTMAVTPNSTLGPLPVGYTFSATSAAGGTASQVIVTNPNSSSLTNVTFTTVLSSSQTYTFSATPYNLAGVGPTTTTSSAVAGQTYALFNAYTSPGTQTITFPTFATKMAAIVIGGGGNGGGNSAYSPGKGGGGGGAVVFKDYTVTGGATASVTVGSALATSSIIVSGTTIAQANPGTSGNTSTAGTGGTATSTVAGAVTVTGGAGGNVNGTGGSVSQLVPYSLTSLNITQGHGGGGGGGAGNTCGGAGGTYGGGRASAYGSGAGGANGTGGGGGGGGYYCSCGPQSAGGGSGGTGSVYIYFK